MPTENESIIIEANDAGQRLDAFLARRLNRSRADIQKKIKAGEVKVDGELAENDVRLIVGVRIEIAPDHAVPTIASPPNPKIVAEDEEVLVLDKPSGLVMHGAPGVREPTLADWILKNRPTIAGVGEDPPHNNQRGEARPKGGPARPGIVHRLDREASGLVVIAKTQPAYDFLKSAFQKHHVEKHYLALVHGFVPQETDTITFPIERSERDGKIIAKAVGGSGRDAETTFTILERIPPFTLLDVVTKTGRTHQVRVHLKAYGYPVIGDPLYHPKHRETKREAPRLFLHAIKLRFPHPDGSERMYTAALPEDLEKFLKGSRA